MGWQKRSSGAAFKWYSVNFLCVFRMKVVGGGGGLIKKYLGGAESTLAGI